jgi:DNA replication protein DnaC
MRNHCDNIADVFSIHNNIKTYHFSKCLDFIETKGKEQFGKKFEIHEADTDIIYKLLIYSIRDRKTAIHLNLDLNKGILLSGPVGCGKTALMYLLKNFAAKTSDYNIKPCRDIAFDFAEKGYESLSKYIKTTGNQNRLSAYCFDDLGTENNLKHFGNECNVMGEILLSRYDHFIDNKSITHLTTNLSATEIESYYGNRVRSRMRAMFNLITFSQNTKDKR